MQNRLLCSAYKEISLHFDWPNLTICLIKSRTDASFFQGVLIQEGGIRTEVSIRSRLDLVESKLSCVMDLLAKPLFLVSKPRHYLCCPLFFPPFIGRLRSFSGHLLPCLVGQPVLCACFSCSHHFCIWDLFAECCVIRALLPCPRAS